MGVHPLPPGVEPGLQDEGEQLQGGAGQHHHPPLKPRPQPLVGEEQQLLEVEFGLWWQVGGGFGTVKGMCWKG